MPYASEGEEHPLTIWNNSQYAVRELRALPPTSANGAEPLQLGALELEAHVEVEAFVSGSTVSFVRDRVEGGEAIEITTEEGVYVDSAGYTLVLWDDGFRLLAPGNARNPFGGEADTSGP